MTYQPSASIDKMLFNAEYNLAKIKAVKAIFPDAIFSSSGYADKSVNKDYTHWDFEDNHSGLVALPYYLLPFEFNGQQENIKIRSIPRRNTMIYKNHPYQHFIPGIINKPNGPNTSLGTLSFSKFFTNMKNREFKEDMLQDCRSRIMKFIADNPKYTLDIKNLDPRLKKLLSFV